MDKSEFTQKAKEMGYSNSSIAEILKNRADAEAEGITNIPFEDELIELPVD